MNPFNLKKYVVQTLVAVLVMAFFHLGCEHDPVIDLADLPTFDTTNTIIDTTGTGGNPNEDICSPDSIYFENDILPILISNCAIPGCHDASSASCSEAEGLKRPSICSASDKTSSPRSRSAGTFSSITLIR